MKKILSLLGTITLIGTSITSLVACDNNNYNNKFEKKTISKTTTTTRRKQMD
ncbi:MAG: lipoprotein [Spiroplasma sp. hy2]|uniref:lipoprotein n=1 Tax=Spiroplasma sp. hy2 TaxID=2490850 RepID=UPI003B736DC5